MAKKKTKAKIEKEEKKAEEMPVKQEGKVEQKQVMQEGKYVCIMCEQEKGGSAVHDDAIINAIRKVKKTFGVAKNNRLVVCAECMPKYKDKGAGSRRRSCSTWRLPR